MVPTDDCISPCVVDVPRNIWQSSCVVVLAPSDTWIISCGERFRSNVFLLCRENRRFDGVWWSTLVTNLNKYGRQRVSHSAHRLTIIWNVWSRVVVILQRKVIFFISDRGLGRKVCRIHLHCVILCCCGGLLLLRSRWHLELIYRWDFVVVQTKLNNNSGHYCWDMINCQLLTMISARRHSIPLNIRSILTVRPLKNSLYWYVKVMSPSARSRMA